MTTCIASHLSPASPAGPVKVARGRAASAARGVIVAALVTACGDAAPRASAPSASATSTAAGASSTGRAPAPDAGSSARRRDGRWAAALASDDPGEAAALAAHLGPVPLAEALSDEDAVRALALRALPHADRPDLALEALGRALGDGRGDEGAVADTIERALVATRRDVELVAPDGIGACAAALDRVAAAGGQGTLGGERAAALAARLRERLR